MFVKRANQTRIVGQLASASKLRLSKGFQATALHNWGFEADTKTTANKNDTNRPKVLGYFSGGMGSFSSQQNRQNESKPQGIPLGGKAWTTANLDFQRTATAIKPQQQRPPFFANTSANGTETSERFNNTGINKRAPELPRNKAILQAKIDKTIKKRLEKTRKESSFLSQERAPRDEEIQHPMITLITLDGVVDGVHPLSHVLNTMDRSEYTLILVDTHRSPPACRVFSKKLLYEKERQAKKTMKAAAKSTKQQSIQMSATIGDHDLGIKIKKALDLLDKGRRVMIVVEHKGRDGRDNRCKVVGGRIMEMVAGRCSVSSPPAVDGKTWSVVLQGKSSSNT
ncbi:hypothetical protein FB639_006059 [Coemansia asiatica]|nr:hypothetical protein FB639_006059 [Coemansia asiatica]